MRWIYGLDLAEENCTSWHLAFHLHVHYNHIDMKINIRSLESSEVHRLQHLPFARMETHRRRFALQESGKLIFLVAWWGNLPVAQALLNWQGGDASGVPPQIRPWPEVSSLFVSSSYRRLGIASLLLDASEQIAFQHGYDNIGLCVYVDNQPALNLYERREYKDAGWEPYLARGTYIDPKGYERDWEETRIYLLKSLVSSPSSGEMSGERQQNEQSAG